MIRILNLIDHKFRIFMLHIEEIINIYSLCVNNVQLFDFSHDDFTIMIYLHKKKLQSMFKVDLHEKKLKR